MTNLGTVAVIGLGRMGSAMARRIRGAGFDLVVWNRDKAKAVELASEAEAKVASTAAEASASCDFLVSSLADDAALESVYLGPDGVVAGITGTTIAMDTSTVAPDTIRAVGAEVDARAEGFLDCPVSGSVSTVEAGALSIMAGGDAVLLSSVSPVLESISKRIIHVGGRGAGAACKLAVNSLLHGLNVALSEALVLAERAGVERKTAYEVFASGAAAAPFLDYKRTAFENPDQAAVAFSLDLVAKDLELITGLASETGTPVAQAAIGLEIVRRAIAQGMGELDMSALAVFLRDRAG